MSASSTRTSLIFASIFFPGWLHFIARPLFSLFSYPSMVSGLPITRPVALVAIQPVAQPIEVGTPKMRYMILKYSTEMALHSVCDHRTCLRSKYCLRAGSLLQQHFIKHSLKTSFLSKPCPYSLLWLSLGFLSDHALGGFWERVVWQQVPKIRVINLSRPLPVSERNKPPSPECASAAGFIVPFQLREVLVKLTKSELEVVRPPLHLL